MRIGYLWIITYKIDDSKEMQEKVSSFILFDDVDNGKKKIVNLLLVKLGEFVIFKKKKKKICFTSNNNVVTALPSVDDLFHIRCICRFQI